MVEEGEFKKRLSIILTDDNIINKTIDEAKKEFPDREDVEYYVYTEDTGEVYDKRFNEEKYNGDIADWFKKWFGE